MIKIFSSLKVGCNMDEILDTKSVKGLQQFLSKRFLIY